VRTARAAAIHGGSSGTSLRLPATGVIAERGRIEVLVNNERGGYQQMTEHGEYTWTLPFRRQPQFTRSAGCRFPLI